MEAENLWSKISAKRSQKLIARIQRRNSIMISRFQQDLSKNSVFWFNLLSWIARMDLYFPRTMGFFLRQIDHKCPRIWRMNELLVKKVNTRQKSSVDINLPHQYVDKFLNFILRLVWTGKILLNLHELVLNHLKTSYNVMSYAISYSSNLFESIFYLKILRIRHFLLR